MPARSSIVLTDGTTPVTLDPRNGGVGKTEYIASVGPTAAANPRLVFQYRDTANGVNRQSISYKEPIVATDSTTNTTVILGNGLVDINIAIPAACTNTQRVRLVKRAFSALQALEAELTTGAGQW